MAPPVEALPPVDPPPVVPLPPVDAPPVDPLPPVVPLPPVLPVLALVAIEVEPVLVPVVVPVPVDVLDPAEPPDSVEPPEPVEAGASWKQAPARSGTVKSAVSTGGELAWPNRPRCAGSCGGWGFVFCSHRDTPKPYQKTDRLNTQDVAYRSERPS